jgi:hypothetical protein
MCGAREGLHREDCLLSAMRVGRWARRVHDHNCGPCPGCPPGLVCGRAPMPTVARSAWASGAQPGALVTRRPPARQRRAARTAHRGRDCRTRRKVWSPPDGRLFGVCRTGRHRAERRIAPLRAGRIARREARRPSAGRARCGRRPTRPGRPAGCSPQLRSCTRARPAKPLDLFTAGATLSCWTDYRPTLAPGRPGAARRR